jgi:anti-sigma regulatory factor (Ser/Thr protein kinase)
MVTHELRQPLGTLQFGLKMLSADEGWNDHEKRDRLFATCERNVTSMGETLGKLVALLRSADGAENALVQRVHLSALVADVVQQLREMAEARGVDVVVAQPLPSITVDVARLELVLVNLISNAVKYSDPRKPKRVIEIDMAPSERADVCAIRIRDNGIGIAESALKSIFSGFYRGHASRDGELGNSGLGLGLSIVHDCIGVELYTERGSASHRRVDSGGCAYVRRGTCVGVVSIAARRWLFRSLRSPVPDGGDARRTTEIRTAEVVELMPEPRTIERARKDKQTGKAPTTQAGEFVREEIRHVREGKHGARSAKQAIAIGLSKARRAGVELPPRGASARTSASADAGRAGRRRRPSARRSRAVPRALRRESRAAATRRALARQARSAARRRSATARRAAARKAVRTKGRQVRRAAARKAVRTKGRQVRRAAARKAVRIGRGQVRRTAARRAARRRRRVAE